MHPLIIKFASGGVFFAGLAMTAAALALLRRKPGKWGQSLLTVTAALGILLAILSATPLPIWAYAAWIVAVTAGITISIIKARQDKVRMIIITGAILATVIFAMAENQYHVTPTVKVPAGTTVYVIGDSISAGIGGEDRCWPTVLGDEVKLPVVNLASHGAKVAGGLLQARQIGKPKSLVLVEIGGNDLLGTTDVASFERQLHQLIASLRGDGHQVVMFELPLFPLKNGFGRAQRQIADQFDVVLLPKKTLTRVLAMPDGTVDGLHLSQAGHTALARAVAESLKVE